MMTTSKKAGSAEKARPPVRTLRSGAVLYAKIWERQIVDRGAFYSVSFERRYKGKDGKWSTTHSFGRDDLLALSKLAEQAHTEIMHLLTPDDE